MKRWIFGAGLACALLFASPLFADNISDYFRVTDPNGKVVYQFAVSEGIEDPNEIYFINVKGLVDPSQFGNATTLVEPDGSFSDIFGIASINGDLFLAFNSDSETSPAAYGNQGNIFLEEGQGGTWDATMYLNPSLQAQGYTAQFWSDGDVVVPEPGTMALLGAGLMGVIGSLRKRL